MNSQIETSPNLLVDKKQAKENENTAGLDEFDLPKAVIQRIAKSAVLLLNN
jgi:hypothetical protein